MDTIKLQPTWIGCAPLLLALIENGSDTGRKYAIEEVKRMALVADLHVAQADAEADPEPVEEATPKLTPEELYRYCGTHRYSNIIGYYDIVGKTMPCVDRADWVTHDTVVGYLARHHPDLLHHMDDHADATQRDGYWCGHSCVERGLRAFLVTAPPVLQEQGIERVRAWPIEVLRDRFDS